MKSYITLPATIVLAILFFAACREDVPEPQKETSKNEGIIHFKLEYPFIDTSQTLLQSVAPRKLDFYIKDHKFTSKISRGKLFCMLMIGKPLDDQLSLGLEFGTENIMTTLTSEEIKHFRDHQPRLTFEHTEETKTMAGFLCKKSIATYQTDSTKRSFDVWYTEEIQLKNCNWFTPYNEINGMLMDYEFEQYGLRMHIIAQSFEQKKINDAEFEVDNKFKIISFRKFDRRMHQLFDRFNN